MLSNKESFNSTNLFALLPRCVLTKSLSNHLTMKDISALDIACTNKCSRISLLEAFEECEFRGIKVKEKKDYPENYHDNYLTWLVLRKIKVRDLIFKGDEMISKNTEEVVRNVDLSNLVSIRVDGISPFRVSRNTLELLKNVLIILLSPTNKSLTTLDICYFDESILAAIVASPSQLKVLRLAGGKEINSDLSKNLFTKRLTSLTILSLNFIATDYVVIVVAKHIPSLTELYIRDCEITDESVLQLAKGLPKLQYLSLSGTNITGESFIEISKNLKQLRSLEIAYCYEIELETFEVMHSLPYLTHLWALEVDMTDDGLKCLAEQCPSLSELFWGVPTTSHGHNDFVTDEGLIAFAQIRGKSLTKLHVINAPEVTDRSLTVVAENCPELLELSFGGCSIQKTDTFQRLARGCPKLADLSVVEQSWADRDSIPIVIAFFQSLAAFSYSTSSVQNDVDLEPYWICLKSKFPQIKFEEF